MPFVVLDTNVLMQDPMLRGAHILKLLIGCKRCGIRVVVPDLVLDELYGNFQQQLDRAVQTLDSGTKQLARIGIPGKAPAIDTKSQKARYSENILATLRKFDVEVAPYPKISHKEIVNASYSGKKPFKSSGDGHKDYLIFQTILGALKKEPSGHFVTHNFKDFCDDAGDLHPDLKVLVKPEDSLRVSGSAGQFFESVLSPALAEMSPLDNPDAISAAIHDGRFPGFDLGDRLDYILTSELTNGNSDLEVLRTPLNEIMFSSLNETSISAMKVAKLDDDLISIDISGNLELELHGFIDKSDYYGGPEEMDIHIDDGDWNDHVMTAYVTTTARFELTIVFDTTRHEVQSASIELTQ